VALERMISGSPAVRRELAKFELGQIWITDPKIGDLADKQRDRMLEQFDTVAIPLHVVVAPDGTTLARFTYSPLATPKDYVEFLQAGMAKYEAK
jgi:hypothetical protein